MKRRKWKIIRKGCPDEYVVGFKKPIRRGAKVIEVPYGKEKGQKEN